MMRPWRARRLAAQRRTSLEEVVAYALEQLEHGLNASAATHPSVRSVPAHTLKGLSGIVSLGGDALIDSAVLHEPDWA